MTPGTLTVLLATAFAVVAFVAALRWARGQKESETTFRLAYHGMTLSLGIGCVLLMLAILAHDFRFGYVASYSSRDLPLIYQISSFWGGQEGTFLLWAFLGALIGYPLFRKNSWEPGAVMACYLPTIGFLLVLMLEIPWVFWSGGNPFHLAERVLPDGRGLNPLLQDPWMASHPPAVFVGFAALTVPAALALAALFKREEDQWIGPALRWALVGFLSLGVGIVFGGFWAYKVLGWGGYWGWDPVENASLVPWIVVAALLHGLLVQRATGALRRTNLVLALAGYLFVVYSTFLTRSGVLANFSVHSFSQERSFWQVPTNVEMLIVLLVILGVSAYALVRRGGLGGSAIELKAGWPLVLTGAIVFLSMSALLVLVGTSWPLVSTLLGTPSTRDASWYNRVNLPLYIAALALLSLGPFLGWLARPWREWTKKLVVPIVVAAAGTAAALAFGYGGVAALAVFFVALAALTANAMRLVQTARVNVLLSGAAVAHLGFAMMFVGIVASGAWDQKREVKLPIGRPVDALGMTLTYRGHVDGSQPKDQWRIAILRPGRAETDSLVTMYKMADNREESQVMREPTILRELGRDIYVAPLGLEIAAASRNFELVKGKPVPFKDATLTFLKFQTVGGGEQHTMAVEALVQVSRQGAQETIALPFAVVDGQMRGQPVAASSLPGVTFALQRMAVEQGLLFVQADEAGGGAPETLIVEASVKPLMNILWAGTFLLGIGCLVAVVRRYKEFREMAKLGAAPPVAAAASAGITLAGPM